MNNILNKIKGSFYGSAIGDGLGYKTEFLNMDQIYNRWGINGLTEPIGNPIQVTDDTQMAIAVGKSLMDCFKKDENINPSNLEKALRFRYIEWYNDPENYRAPGNTCLQACENLERGITWTEATLKNSKGCGANMRVHPVAYFKFKNKNITNVDVAKWAQFQSAMTHSHPTALAAADLTAMTVVKLIEGVSSDNILEELIEYAHSQMHVYHEDFLENVWERPVVFNSKEFIERGWKECILSLEKVKMAIAKNDKSSDPCIYTGEGWIAEEAFATALLCFLYFPNKPIAVLRRAANSSGDSDSIACLAGSFAGAYCGIDELPSDWVNRIEYQNEMNEFIDFLNLEK
jgi:ADP-ribosylglycohydrolase